MIARNRSSVWPTATGDPESHGCCRTDCSSATETRTFSAARINLQPIDFVHGIEMMKHLLEIKALIRNVVIRVRSWRVRR